METSALDQLQMHDTASYIEHMQRDRSSLNSLSQMLSRLTNDNGSNVTGNGSNVTGNGSNISGNGSNISGLSAMQAWRMALHMAVNHSLTVEFEGQAEGKEDRSAEELDFSGSSPDEKAITASAWILLGTNSGIHVVA